jgi:hypothetical protein
MTSLDVTYLRKHFKREVISKINFITKRNFFAGSHVRFVGGAQLSDTQNLISEKYL